MTTISRDEIQHLASLSALTLDDSEVDSLQVDIERIISYVDTLAELDTKGVRPTYQVTSLQNVWREDEVEESVSSDELFQMAQSSRGSSVRVPKVL